MGAEEEAGEGGGEEEEGRVGEGGVRLGGVVGTGRDGEVLVCGVEAVRLGCTFCHYTPELTLYSIFYPIFGSRRFEKNMHKTNSRMAPT